MTSKITAPNKGLTKFIAMNGATSGFVQRGKIHGKGEDVKIVKAKDLSLSQTNTLHRLRAGIGYRLRTDGKQGSELRMVNNYNATFVSAPSIPVLYRLGLVDFTNGKPDEAGKFASVMLTRCGWDILEEFDKAVGGK